MNERERIDAAIEIANRFGQIQGSDHKMWVIDQMLRALLGEDYEKFVREANEGDDGPDTYEWDTGIAP